MANVTNMYTWPEKFGWLFQVVDREKLSFEFMEDVPHLDKEVAPLVVVIIVIEHFVSKAMGQGGIKLSDGISSFTNSMLLELFTLFFGGAELLGYVWLYQYRLMDLDFRNSVTFWSAFLIADFMHYVVHRASHEVSLMWSVHQTHHSSEEHNLTTSTRLPAMNRIYRFGFFHLFALVGVPLPTMYLATQINLLGQFWIHTRVINKLGPLEYILMTPSHHRVHHGMNKWCLDKNFGGCLIIWDKLFGTFEPERDDQQIIYGLVSQPQTLNPIKIQTAYPMDIFKKALAMDNWKDSMKAIFYGPGWNPGTPRLGDLSEMPENPEPRKKYDPILPWTTKAYICVHFFLSLVICQVLGHNYVRYSWTTALILSFYIIFTYYSIGAIFDSDYFHEIMEICRCVASAVFIRDGRLLPGGLTGISEIDSAIVVCFSLSAVYWTYRYMNSKVKEE